MCGLTLVCSDSTEILSLAQRQASTEVSLMRRGPDAMSTYLRENSFITHYLLSLTGQFKQQPVVFGDIAIVFNGEIYNFLELGCESEIDAIMATIGSDGLPIPSEVEKLDGEFAIAIIDYSNSRIYVYTDTFSIKPIYVGFGVDNQAIGISSYPGPLHNLGLQFIKRLKPSSIYTFSSQSYQLLSIQRYNQFCIDQDIDSFTLWVEYFEQAILKRARSEHKIFVPLSSGYDSGCIAAGINKLGIDASFYSITGEEDLDILNARARIHSAELIPISKHVAQSHAELIRLSAPSLNYSEFVHDYDCLIWQDPGAIGLSIISGLAAAKGERILLTGQGADETCTDYCKNGKPLTHHSGIKGYFPGSLESIFPWPNFYGGLNMCYISKDEYISGLHGTEGRYCFLDRDVVQSYLRLTPDLKNSQYKAPLAYYMKTANYPFWENEKRGFNALCGI